MHNVAELIKALANLMTGCGIFFTGLAALIHQIINRKG